MTDDIELLDELPPILSSANSWDARAKYLEEVEAAIENPGKWVYLGRGRGIKSVPSSLMKSYREGGSYSKYPILELRFATRVQPDSTYKLYVSYQPGWRDEATNQGDTSNDPTSATA